jgi:hypothetical protein
VGVPPKQPHPSTWISVSAMSACFDVFYDCFHREPPRQVNEPTSFPLSSPAHDSGWSLVLDKSTQTAAKVADSSPLLLATGETRRLTT